MSADQRLMAAVGFAFAATVVLTPVAIWLARVTQFLDRPVGYKGHGRATPYLGGLALGGGIAVPAILFGGAAMEYSPIALGAAALWFVGTVDDRINLPPLTRVVIEAAAAGALWFAGLGWADDTLGLVLTVLWVVGLVNAYNLMDNMDGAAGSVGCVSAVGVAAIALVGGDAVLAALALSVAGACAGFLCFNAASPARIFLGDGGSMPLGFFIAAMAMSVPLGSDLGVLGVVALAPVAALPILDTCLVMVSRRRRGAALLSGGRDHLTHRLHRHLGSPRPVALALAAAQAALCGLALALSQLDAASVGAASVVCIAAGAMAIWLLEQPIMEPAWHAAPAPAFDSAPRPVRVLRVIARLNMGGPSHHVSLLSGRLDSDRYETLLVHGGVGAGEESLEGIADREGCTRRVVPSLGPELRPLQDLRALIELIRIVRKFQPDIVHTHTAKAGLLGRMAAVLAAGRSRPTIVHTYHGHVLEGYFGRVENWIYRGLERMLARVSDCLIGVSAATVDDLVRLGIAPRSKFKVVPIGLDLDPFISSDDREREAFRSEVGVSAREILLTFVGRLVPIKRVDVALEAVAGARALGAPVRLAVVGDGELRDQLEQQSQQLGLDDSVRFLGYRDDMVRVTAGSDIALLTSDNEGTPVSLIEAAASGTPAVATAVGGVAEVATSDSGSIVDAGDADALAQAIASIAADEPGRQRMGSEGRRHVAERFSVDRLLTDVELLYPDLLTARRGFVQDRRTGPRKGAMARKPQSHLA